MFGEIVANDEENSRTLKRLGDFKDIDNETFDQILGHTLTNYNVM